jgi:Delta7-sterol 5-desaturase
MLRNCGGIAQISGVTTPYALPLASTKSPKLLVILANEWRLAVVTMKFLKLSRTPIWVPSLAAGFAVGAIAMHPAMIQLPFTELLRDSIGGAMLEYLGYAVGFFLLFRAVLHRWIKPRLLARKRWPKPSQVAREIMFSTSAQFTFMAVGIWLTFSAQAEAAMMYTDIGTHGWPYLIFTTFLLFVIDDTYFYWTHRMLHHRTMFERFHRVHHESVDPTPFTSYSFHPVETIIIGMGGLVFIPFFMLMPWHPAAVAAFGLGNILFNVIGHLGYELYPARWNRIPLLRWKTPAMHHYLHHQMVGGNYGLYFRWWDKLCGTEFKDFEARYDKFFAVKPTQTPENLRTLSTLTSDANSSQSKFERI